MTDISENSGYTQEDFMKRLKRTGPAISLTMHDKGLSTVIGNDKDSSGNDYQVKQNTNSTD